VTSFSAEWLALRELADEEARDASITWRLAELIQPRSPRRLLDLGSGTGANLRYLAPALSGPQTWILFDSDERLLARVGARVQSWCADIGAECARRGDELLALHRDWQCSIETRKIDLARDLRELPLPKDCVVTASALLDLVSEPWLVQLLERCCASRAVVLFALSYDGRIELNPPEPDDEWIRDLVNRHQRTDKGFGPALGPDATSCAQSRLAGLEYEVRCEPSDWVLEPGDTRIQEWLLKGWAHAAAEVAPGEAGRCSRWLSDRLEHVARRRFRVMVGHKDLIAWPRGEG
jgi:hypothetical protein